MLENATTNSELTMSRISIGLLLGIACGIVAGAVMLPMRFPTRDDKRRAIVAAVLNRVELGFVVANVTLPVPGAAAGAILGLAVSASSAVISRAYVPILVMGTAMGALAGWLTGVLV